MRPVSSPSHQEQEAALLVFEALKGPQAWASVVKHLHVLAVQVETAQVLAVQADCTVVSAVHDLHAQAVKLLDMLDLLAPVPRPAAELASRSHCY